MHENKYKPFPKVDIKNRKWPENSISKAPVWCSVDLRDGNQALITPMSVQEKSEFFIELVKMGFKEIEIGFPSASETEFNFMRKLVEENLIPDDVTIQVLVQAREHLIEKTFEAIKGVKNVIVHLYNSTSTNQRKIVFNKEMQDITKIALQGVQWVKECSKKHDQKVVLEYSPESFSGTELENALSICNSVINEWQPTKESKIIINLPATVEMSTPNQYADMIEWMSDRLEQRENVIVSVHTHNDRGCAVAASELALLAGAQRVEGTLFGNGERTGNADIVTLALNMHTQGVDPGINVFNIDKMVTMFEKYNKYDVHVRHPYAGELVYTAFSGSHQDAIRKGMKYQQEKSDNYWEVPYLPIDPADVGRAYEGVIRINSQSGKGGAAFIIEEEMGFNMPKLMQPDFGAIVQQEADKSGRELSKEEIVKLFSKTYLSDGTVVLSKVSYSNLPDNRVSCEANLKINGKEVFTSSEGDGPVEAFRSAIVGSGKIKEFIIMDYSEHSLSAGASSKAAAYVKLQTPDKSIFWGVGVDKNISIAAVKAVISAVNRI